MAHKFLFESIMFRSPRALMIGRDFTGDDFLPMRVCATNVPRTGWADIFKAWENVRGQLPKEWREPDDGKWKQTLFRCLTPKEQKTYTWYEEEVPTTKQLYTFRLSSPVQAPILIESCVFFPPPFLVYSLVQRHEVFLRASLHFW